ncbi:MAG: hypothetical protein AAGU74_07755 [Bacillota bacterium]
MKGNTIRHMFPGNNTGQGFFSYFAYILPQSQARRFYCLKGGPGVGKSTFLKRIGDRMAQEGFDLEYMHCASDPDSLDGLVIPALGVALIDGTAPHVIDPVYPAAVDEIVNLGEYWDAEAIRKNRGEIVRINGEIRQQYKRTFKYLAAAKCLMDDIAETFEAATDKAGPAQQAQRIIDAELARAPGGGRPGGIRRMFAAAVTPDGIVHHLESLLEGASKVYRIKNLWGAGVNELLERVTDEAVRRGLDAELYYCPLAPDTRIEHVLIPELKLAFFSEDRSFEPKLENRYQETLDMTQYTDLAQIALQEDALEFGIGMFDTLLGEAVNVLARTKKLHDELEVYYIPHMDFERVRQKEEAICGQILAERPPR